MKLQKVPRLILAALLCLTITAVCGGHGGVEARSGGSCPSPPKYRHIPRSSCSRLQRVARFFREKRDHKSYEETRTNEQIRNEHNNLINSGYVFIGWHGTTYDVGSRLVNGETYTTSPRSGTDRIWMGVWTSSNIERSVGYMEGDSALLRVYIKLPQGATQSLFIDGTDINDAVKTSHFCNHNNPSSSEMLAGNGNYIIAGPDGSQFGGQELVISRGLIPNVKFLYSAHNKDIRVESRCAEHQRNNNNIEKTHVDWSMDNTNAFLASMRSATVFK